MKETRLTYLFKVYFNKTDSPAEREELMELLARSENDAQVKLLLKETWEQFNNQEQPFSKVQGDEMLAIILSAETVSGPIVTVKPERSVRWQRSIAVAAIFITLIAGVYFLLHTSPPASPIVQNVVTPKIIKDAIVPGGNKAVLTLADGSKITLDSTHQGAMLKQGNAKLINLNSSTLAYNAGNENNQEIVYNTLSTFNGGQYHVVLSDGTNVWLNASSSIYYPTIFKGNERNVTVTGEAYFEVAKNATMPFKIKVRDTEVRVLGTHFNIMAYDDENSINTTLLEGSVKISSGELTKILMPGQESRIHDNGNIKILEADTEAVMAWKNGWFQFNAYDIQKVMRQVSRWYNVEVEYDGKIPPGHFTGSVSRENNISQVLKIMEAGGVGFKIDGRKVRVYSGKPNSS